MENQIYLAYIKPEAELLLVSVEDGFAQTTPQNTVVDLTLGADW